MIGDVAMQHPIAWIVGDKCDIDRFFWCNKDGIGPLPVRDRGFIAAQNTEAMAMQMDWMPKGRVVAEGQQAALRSLQRQQRRHTGVTIASHRVTVDRPDCTACGHHAAPSSRSAHHPASTHHPALQRKGMAIGGG